MKHLDKLKKVSDGISMYRYTNGWMVEISGRDYSDEWKTIKLICNTEEELLNVIQKYNTIEVD